VRDPRRDEDEYFPAERPPDAPGGDRVRFEREGDVEQGIFGGSALDVESGIMKNTEWSTWLIGRSIIGIGSSLGAMGAGTLQEITLRLSDGSSVTFSGVGMKVERS